ncbi:MAG: hypothetical protein HC836_37285 [Richelia sp. RM2_1_2]|nr:hypothetical protein [Richelia sp. RM2_1_2]
MISQICVLIFGYARVGKDYKLCDEIRNYLDTHLVFVFDAPHGQEVYYLTDSYFKWKSKIEQLRGLIFTNRKFVEYRIKEDIRISAIFEGWLVTTKNSK